MNFNIAINSLFPTKVYSVKIQEDFCDSLVAKVINDKENWSKGLLNVNALTCGWDGLEKYEELRHISDFISKSILPEIGKIEKWTYNNWHTHEAWINLYQKGDSAKVHNHKYMSYCGVLILKPGNGNLIFSSQETIEHKLRPFMPEMNGQINESKGTLILFPDYMYHSVSDCENERISVAFNFMNKSIEDE